MTAEIVDSPQFAAETDQLLKLFANQPEGPDLDPYQALLLDREELPDPELAGECDPRTHPEDLTITLPDRRLQARVYRPLTSGPRPVVLWLHGGGFIGGDLRDIEYATSGIAVAGNVIVVSLNYRLAPEYPYPAGLHDVRDSLDWLREHTPSSTVTAGSRSAARVRVPRSPPAPACSRATRALRSPTARSSATHLSTWTRTPSRTGRSTAPS